MAEPAPRYRRDGTIGGSRRSAYFFGTDETKREFRGYPRVSSGTMRLSRSLAVLSLLAAATGSTMLACGSDTEELPDGDASADGATTTTDGATTTADGSSASDGGSGDGSSDGGARDGAMDASSDGATDASSDGAASNDGGASDAATDGGSDASTGACTMPSDCTVATATCVFGRCMTPVETTTTLTASQTVTGMRSSYLPAGHELFLSYRDSSQSYPNFIGKGPFGMVKAISGGVFSAFDYEYLARPDRASYGVYATPITGSRDQVTFVGTDAAGAPTSGGYVQFASNTRASLLHAAENDAGDRYLVARAIVSRVNQPDRCEIQITKKAAAGAFGAPELVAGCEVTLLDLAVYTDTTGQPVVLAFRDTGVTLYTRRTVADPWTTTIPWTFPINRQPRMRLAQSHDGRAHVHFSIHTASGSVPAEHRIYTLDGTAVSRDLLLGTFSGEPFGSFQALADDSLSLLRVERSGTASYDPTAYRISPAGTIASRGLGLVPGGVYAGDTLATAADGELSLVHTADARTLLLRRLVPTP